MLKIRETVRRLELTIWWLRVAVVFTIFLGVTAQLRQAAPLHQVDPLYVLKTGSTSTGRQVFAGSNGQINLPESSFPAFPIEGDIQNTATDGVMVYHSGVWESIASHAAGQGIYVATSPTAGTTITGMQADNGLAFTTSGNTATIQPVYDTLPNSVMQGDQQLAGDVTQGVTNTKLSSSVNVETTGTVSSTTAIVAAYGEQNTVAQLDSTGKVTGTAPGTAGQVLTSNGSSPPTFQTISAGSSAGGYRNLVVAYASTTSVSITADGLDLFTISNTMTSVFNVAQNPSLSVSGIGGLDAGAVASDEVYYEYIVEKSDLSSTSAILSLASSFSGVAVPSGWSNWYGRRVGACFTLHSSTHLIQFRQMGNEFKFWNQTDVATTSDGNRIVNGGTATSMTTVNLSPRMPATSSMALLRWDSGFVTTATTEIQIKTRPTGSTASYTSFFGELYNTTANNGAKCLNFGYSSTSASQQIDYEVVNCTGGCYIDVIGYQDNL